MLDFFRKLFSTDFMPHGHCYMWQPEVIWTHVLADGFITLSYYSIPLALIYLVRKRRDIAFEWVFVMFGLFIMACGTTHLLEIVSVWNPVYRLAGLVKAITAVASVSTAVVLCGLMPRIIALPSPTQLRESNRRLEAEIGARREAEEALIAARDGLEERVRERTAELARANGELRASQEQLQAILDHSPVVVFLKDPGGRYLLVNRAFEQLFHVANETIRGQTDDALMPREMADAVRANDRRVFESRTPLEIEETVPRPDGLHTYLSVKFPLLGTNQSPYAICGIARDVTESRRALFEVRAARDQAEAANRAKDEFLATLSHELRTPLNAILGWTRMMVADPEDAATRTTALGIIERNTRSQVRLIEDLLDVSRVTSGKMRLEVGPMDPAAVVRAALDSVQPTAAAREVAVESDLAPDAGPVSGDPDRLQQVVWNLLSNAIKFTPRGGRVRVRLERRNSFVQIVVADTGAGIAADFLPHVFERFQQADSSSTRTYQGLGLGLAITRHLVELHGGTITAESPGVGRGATFTVRLPVGPLRLTGEPAASPAGSGDGTPAPEADPAAMPPRSRELDGVRVLAVDDDTDGRNLLSALLGRAGATVTTAAGAAEGLATFLRDGADVILSDIEMPGQDGYEFISQVRALANADGGSVPAIALTAYARPEDRRLALAAGFHRYLAKPVEPEELIRVVTTLAGRAVGAG